MPAQHQAQQPTASALDIPKRWPLATQPDNRDSGYLKDARLVNCYAERDPETGGYQVEKRYGLGPLVFTHSAANGYGIYTYSAPGVAFTVIIVVGVSVYTLVGTAILPIGSLFNGVFTRTARFLPVPNAVSGPFLLFGDGGQNPYYLTGISPNSVSQVTDPNYPSHTVPGFAFLDGTTYVMDNTGAIYGSAGLNDPRTWDPLNVIRANAYSDIGITLTKQLTYVVALKSTSTQFFYDAGNATGSPLAPVPGALLNYGCLSADTLAEIDGLLIWATSNSTNSSQILLLENLGMKIVSTPGIERQLDLASPTSVYKSFAVKHGGHRLYILTNVTTNVTLVYDIDQHLWYQWTDYLGNYYPIVAQAVDGYGNHIFQHAFNGNIYTMDIDFVYPNDYGNVYPVDIYTPNFDAEVDRIKYLSMMRFNGDQTKGSKLQVRFSENDYGTWNNFRTVHLDNKRPILVDCGSFYRRAYHFRHQCNTPFRIESVDLQMDIGTL